MNGMAVEIAQVSIPICSPSLRLAQTEDVLTLSTDWVCRGTLIGEENKTSSPVERSVTQHCKVCI